MKTKSTPDATEPGIFILKPWKPGGFKNDRKWFQSLHGCVYKTIGGVQYSDYRIQGGKRSMGCHMSLIVPGNSIRGGFAKAAPRNSISSAVNHGPRAARRCFRILVPAIWMFALFLLAAGCGIDLSTPSIASSDPKDLTGTWVGTLEEDDGGLYDTKVVFNSQGQMSAFTIYKPLSPPDTVYTGTVEGLDGSDKLFKITINETGKEGGLVADSTFSHAGIIIDGFSAGVLQKTNDPAGDKTSNGTYSLSNIAGVFVGGSIDWTGNMMRVVVTNGTIEKVEAYSSTVTISYDGSFIGNDDFNGNIQNTTIPDGKFYVDDGNFGRYLGAWEKTPDDGTTGPVVILITPDKNFLGSFSCVDPDRTLDACDFHLWKKQ